MFKNFEKKYIFHDYNEYRENILWEKELGLLPQTQSFVEKEIKAEIVNDEIRKLQSDISEHENIITTKYRFIDSKKNEIRDLYNNKEIVRRTYVRKCPKELCHGFLSQQLKCDLCNTWVCGQCREIKGITRDAEHICDPNILSSVQAIENDSKPCPKCASLIYKIEGCNQMFCTECKTCFDWRTLRIFTGAIHNPHYFEWRRINQEENQVIPAGQINNCNGELDHTVIDDISRAFITHFYNSFDTRFNNVENFKLLEENFILICNNASLKSCSIFQEYRKKILTKFLELNSRMNTSHKYYQIIKILLVFYEKIVSHRLTNLQLNDIITVNEPVIVDFIKNFKIDIIFDSEQKINFLNSIVRNTIHIHAVEINRFNVGDRINENLDLRISYMRNKITMECMKTEIRKRDMKIQRNNELRNILNMYVTCIRDLVYRIANNVSEYENILNEMNQLRDYTNETLKNTFKLYGSNMQHHITELFDYVYFQNPKE
jgi:hypothetical protein